MLEHLTKETCRLMQTAATWEDAVRAAGGLLEAAGTIKPAYTDAMVGMVRDNGPYIVIMPGVALAHARPEGNVMENSIGLVTIRGGVAFGNKANDPAIAVFAIAAKTDEDHLVLFREVAKFIEDEKNVQALFAARRYEDLPL